jgi:CheY-like chemotaxis protein
MGRIHGDVSVLGISNLLQMLSMNSCRGFLVVQQDGQKKVIHFQDPGIRLVSGARRTNPLGEILMRTGRITREQLDELLAEQRRTGTPLGELVTTRGILASTVIESALREQVAEEIYDLFTWSEASFDFFEGNATEPLFEPGPLAAVPLDQNMMSIMIEAARRVDELARIQSLIPDVRLVPQRLELPALLDDPSLDRSAIEDIIPLVDGSRSVGHIIEESLFPKFTVLRTLYGLTQRGVLKIRDTGEGDTGPITVLRRPGVPGADRPSGKGRTVLLLSQLPTYRTALALCVRSEGYDVVEAEAEDDAVRTLERQAADVVVLDVPIETDGALALCERFRKTKPVPFIVLSANASKQAIAHAMQSGARYVLIKPFREDLLLERIANVLKA